MARPDKVTPIDSGRGVLYWPGQGGRPIGRVEYTIESIQSYKDHRTFGDTVTEMEDGVPWTYARLEFIGPGAEELEEIEGDQLCVLQLRDGRRRNIKIETPTITGFYLFDFVDDEG